MFGRIRGKTSLLFLGKEFLFFSFDRSDDPDVGIDESHLLFGSLPQLGDAGAVDLEVLLDLVEAGEGLDLARLFSGYPLFVLADGLINELRENHSLLSSTLGLWLPLRTEWDFDAVNDFDTALDLLDFFLCLRRHDVVGYKINLHHAQRLYTKK